MGYRPRDCKESDKTEGLTLFIAIFKIFYLNFYLIYFFFRVCVLIFKIKSKAKNNIDIVAGLLLLTSVLSRVHLFVTP